MRHRLSDGNVDAPLLIYVGRIGAEKKLHRLKKGNLFIFCDLIYQISSINTSTKQHLLLVLFKGRVMLIIEL